MTREFAATRSLQEYPKARKIAVMNFVGSLVGIDRRMEVQNVYLDAKLYKWNQDTVDAIIFGIHLFYDSLN
jgi:hypothetical protein